MPPESTPTPTPTPTSTPTPTPTPTPEPAAWHSTFDPESQGWIQNKGWDKLPADKALPEIVKSFRNTEQYIGVPADQLVRLPKAGDDKALGTVYDRLGRPADPNAYDLKLPDTVAPELKPQLDALKPVMHKIGLNNQQANQLANELVAMEQASDATAKAEMTARMAADTKALRTEWGAAYEKNLSVVEGVAAQLGLDEAKLVALRTALGPAGAMKMLAGIGAALGEDKFIGAEGGGKFAGAMSPAQAQAKIDQLKRDSDFTMKLRNGNAEAKAEWDRLHVALAAR